MMRELPPILSGAPEEQLHQIREYLMRQAMSTEESQNNGSGQGGTQGPKGAKGDKGDKGEPGERGPSGFAIQTVGYVSFRVNEEGHLICSYSGDEVPKHYISDEGHLIISV